MALDPILERRLAAFLARRPAGADGGPVPSPLAPANERPRAMSARELAHRLAEGLGGEVVATGAGTYVRIEQPERSIPVDRARLGVLPGQPPPAAPLVCLDTETTGLGSAAGTVAFLIGLGWWVGDERFRQVQLVLPEHGEEGALLAALADLVPASGWLVTYNGRGFDWPLLVTRYRMHATSPPAHDGHLDLLPIVRRVFRHRLADARLRTVEAALLGMSRPGDVDGWQIPDTFLAFLRDGDPARLADVVRHNDQDVRSLARLVGLLERSYGDREARRRAPAGDLAGLARAYAREDRLEEALECVDAALAARDAGWRDPFPRRAGPTRPDPAPGEGPDLDERGEPWWSPRRPADVGGRGPAPRPPTAPHPLVAPWTTERVMLERARLLRRLGRTDEAIEAWRALGAGSGHLAAAAWIEVARLEERVRHDPAAALRAAEAATRIVERGRLLGRAWPGLEGDLRRRRARLRRRLAARTSPRVVDRASTRGRLAAVG